MPVYRLDEDLIFPPAHLAQPNGLLAVGGDLTPERLLLAYSEGIFPWYEDGMPILWHSPDPRMVLQASKLRINRSLRKAIRRKPYELRFDTAFQDVISACAQVHRPDQGGTWITDDMQEAYVELHRLGFAHSAEAWRDGELVGGLYGISLGRAFFGESMFAYADNASKIAFAGLAEHLASWDIELIDCQVHTEHLDTFGAERWARKDFLEALEGALDYPTKRGQWHCTETPA